MRLRLFIYGMASLALLVFYAPWQAASSYLAAALGSFRLAPLSVVSGQSKGASAKR